MRWPVFLVGLACTDAKGVASSGVRWTAVLHRAIPLVVSGESRLVFQCASAAKSLALDILFRGLVCFAEGLQDKELRDTRRPKV